MLRRTRAWVSYQHRHLWQLVDDCEVFDRITCTMIDAAVLPTTAFAERTLISSMLRCRVIAARIAVHLDWLAQLNLAAALPLELNVRMMLAHHAGLVRHLAVYRAGTSRSFQTCGPLQPG